MQENDSTESKSGISKSPNQSQTKFSEMPSALSRNLPMNVNGSGTSWLPKNSPMYMNMFHKKKWNFMLHYSLFFTYSNQNINRSSGQRGGSAFYIPNWIMVMITRPIGKHGMFMIRRMVSADPLTVGGAGYPLLFQTGETWKDKALIDHQHPHDLVSEFSLAYSYTFNKKVDLYGYFGIPGEPALGPPAFMHRPSSFNISSAPLGHHWQDATHLTFGVATIGFRYGNMKLEGSSFTGREPNENRYIIDKPRFDSYSTRISFLVGNTIVLQTSYAFITSPELLFPKENIERFTASVLHNHWFDENKVISSTVVWGMNKYCETGKILFGQSVLLESNLQCKKYNYSTKIEWVQKDNKELLINSMDEHHKNNIGALSLGISRYIVKNRYFWLDLGAVGTGYAFNKELNIPYGRNPWSLQVYLRVVPPRMPLAHNNHS